MSSYRLSVISPSTTTSLQTLMIKMEKNVRIHFRLDDRNHFRHSNKVVQKIVEQQTEENMLQMMSGETKDVDTWMIIVLMSGNWW